MKGNFDTRIYNHKVNLCDNCQRSTHVTCDGAISFHPKYEDKWFCCHFCLHEYKLSRGNSAREYVSELRKRRKREKMRNIAKRKMKTSVSDLLIDTKDQEERAEYQYNTQEEDYNSLNPQTYQ